MDELTHVDDAGRARMVDVGGKTPQRRTARAEGSISLAADTLRLIRENRMKKGDVLAVAQVAGIQAAKRTAELIPLCHTLALEKVDVQLSLGDEGVTAVSEVRCTGKTGVEMEALTAVSVALLAVYDMCKAVDAGMRIGEIRLIEKVKEDVAD
ncbi:MAG: cyclic pyranopterin monophosphate synthase MoaC [Phycisphaerae bacterium]